MIFSGSESGKKFRIRPDPEPQHWSDPHGSGNCEIIKSCSFLRSWLNVANVRRPGMGWRCPVCEHRSLILTLEQSVLPELDFLAEHAHLNRLAALKESVLCQAQAVLTMCEKYACASSTYAQEVRMRTEDFSYTSTVLDPAF